MITNRTKWIAFSICFILLAIAMLLQWHCFLNRDAVWALDISNRMLHGGTYLKDFVENNPPMIFFLNFIPILSAKLFHITNITGFRIFVFLVGVVSLLLVSRLLIASLERKTPVLYVMLMAMTTFCYFLLPVDELGEREHLMMMLVFPYILLALNVLLAKQTSLLLRIIVGILAGIGFSFKPYFLFPLVLIEVYLMLNKRSLWAWVRMETSCIASVFIIYLVMITLVTPLYLTKMIPLAVDFYLGHMTSSPSLMLNNIFVLFVVVALIANFCLGKTDSNHIRKLNTILLLGVIGFFLSYLLQFRAWYYHLLPAMMFTCLLITSLFYNSFQQVRALSYASAFSIMKVVVVPAIFIVFCLTPIVTQSNEMVSEKYCRNNVEAQLILFVREHARHKSLYFFTTYQYLNTLMVQYGDSKLGSRFMDQWLIPAVVNDPSNIMTQRKAQAIRLLQNMTVEDFKKYKPDYVFVDVDAQKPYINQPFNYLYFFNQDPRFKSIWRQYHFVKRVWHFDVYER